MSNQRARELRCNSTDAEIALWGNLRKRQVLGYKFRRQEIFGPYIVDFVCLELKLIVEVDGGQHMEQEEYDDRRTQYLEKRGYRVVRFWNHDVLNNREAVLARLTELMGIDS